MTGLRVEQVTKRFGGVRAVDNVSFTLEDGDFAALIGPNGAGKSTLFNLIDGQLAPDSGAVTFDNQALARRSTAERTQLGIGRTFQVAQTFATMTPLQNVQLALVAADGGALRCKDLLWNMHVPEAHALLQSVGLHAHAATAAANLAYGDLKRLELALALSSKPRLLLMDEPTAGMAPEERFALMRLVSDIARASRMTVLFTEHSMDVVFGFARRVMVLSRGQLVADGEPDAVRIDAEVQRVYLGDEAGQGT